MKKFIVTLSLLAGLVVVGSSIAEAGSHFGRMAFIRHQSPSTLHYQR